MDEMRKSPMEKAEGDRERATENAGREQRERAITNRSEDVERENQERVPERGERQDGERAENPVMPDDDATLRTEI